MKQWNSGNMLDRETFRSPFFHLYVNHHFIWQNMMKYVEEMTVEDEEDALPLARVSITDVDSLWINDKNLIKGAPLMIYAGHVVEHTNARKIFDGKITHIEADFGADGVPRIVIGALDKAVDLMKKREPRSWQWLKASDIMYMMFTECGIKADVQDSLIVHENIQQDNETNLEFITRWRKKLGWRFFRKDDGSYYVGENTARDGKIPNLGYKTGGMEIISFQPIYVQQETEEVGEEQEHDNYMGKLTTKKQAKLPKLTGNELNVSGGGYTASAKPVGLTQVQSKPRR